MKFRSFLFGSLVLAMFSLSAAPVVQGPPTKNAVPQDVRKAILSTLDQIQAAAEERDADKVFSFVMENDNGCLAQGGRVQMTRQDALESTRRGFKGIAAIKYTLGEQHITLLSPTTALVVAEGTSLTTLEDGRVIRNPFAQSVVMILADGQWKMFHAHRSIAAPGR